MFFSRFVTGFLLSLALDAGGQKPITASKQSAKTAVPPKSYVTSVAKANDNAGALLTRYGLNDYECNLTQFLKLNNLRKGSALKPAATYKLPIEVVTYNGRSIRTTLNIDDWRTAKRIEIYNKSALEEGLRTDNFIQTKRLWVPWHELNCPTPKEKIVVAEASLAGAGNDRAVPSGLGEKSIGKTSRNYSIFGKKYQNTPLVSSKLKGKVFYLVSGHGGPDSGARGKRSGRTLCEDEYAYDVSLRLLRLLLGQSSPATA